MGRTIPCKLVCYAAWILGGLMLMFFGAFIIGEGILGDTPLFRSALSANQIFMLVGLGIALLGLFVAYFKPLAGGVLGVIGSLGFLYFSDVGPTSLVSWLGYLLLAAAVLHVITWGLKRRELAPDGDRRVMAEPG
jgi:hypothetical protein